MDAETAAQCRELGRLVRDLTQSGRPELDAAAVGRVKQLCRLGDAHVDAAYEHTLRQLRRQHAEARLSALQLMDTLFRRSHRFRLRAVADLQTLVDLCFETAGPLPRPRSAARRLTALAADALRHWAEKYGDGYGKLAVGYRYLRQTRPGDLGPTQEEEREAARVTEQEQERLERLKRLKLTQLQREVAERRQDIIDTVTQVESCFSLLLPDVRLESGSESGDDTDDSREDADWPEVFAGHAAVRAESGRSSADPAPASRDPAPSSIDPMPRDPAPFPNDPTPPGGDIDPHCADSEPGPSAAGAASDDEQWYDPDYADTGLLRSHGLTSARHTVQVELPAAGPVLTVTDDNVSLVDTLRELMTAVRRVQLPTVQRWVQLAAAAGGGAEVTGQLTSVRAALASAVRRYDSLQLHTAADSDDDDDDMEEVPALSDMNVAVTATSGRSAATSGQPAATSGQPAATSGQPSATSGQPVATSGQPVATSGQPAATSGQPVAISGQPAAISGQPAASAGGGPVSASQPSTACQSVVTSGQSAASVGDRSASAAPSADSGRSAAGGAGAAEAGVTGPPSTPTAGDDRKSHLLSVAPQLAYSVDLVTWGRDPTIRVGPAPQQCEVTRVWRADSEADQPPVQLAADQRVVEFAGRFEPVRHTCGAPLPSGRLCPRADRLKCPLHGPVVARDERGRPLDPAARTRQREARARGDDWQDPRLLSALKASTGLDLLVRRGRRRRGGGSGVGGLTDVRRATTARQRLRRKLFSGATVRRLAAALDRVEGRRHADKFGDQFNYQVTGR